MTEPFDQQIILAIPWGALAMLGASAINAITGRSSHGRQLESEDARHAASLADRRQAREMTSADWRWMVQQELEQRRARREGARPAVDALLGRIGGAQGVSTDAFMEGWQGGAPPVQPPAPVGAGQQPMPVVSAGPPPQGGGVMNPLLQYLIYSQMGGGQADPSGSMRTNALTGGNMQNVRTGAGGMARPNWFATGA